MKKLIISTTFFSLFFSSMALAKTEGSYFGVDLLRVSSEAETSKVSSTNADTYFDTKVKDSKTSFGLHYKYAINFNNFFVSPGVFYENLGLEHGVDDSANQYTQNLDLKSRYGVKVDFGYDISDSFAAYIPLGYSLVNYELTTKDSLGASYLATETSGREGALFYGVGLAFYPHDNIALSLEYNRSSLDLESGGNVALIGSTNLDVKTNLNTIKFGVSYKF